jgi:transposase
LTRRISVDARLARKREILISIPGFGQRISTLLITDMPELGTIDRKAAASLAGHAPHPMQSGLSKGRNAIAGGRPCLRAAFYMAALVAARTNPKFKQLYKECVKPANPPKSLSLQSQDASSLSPTHSCETTCSTEANLYLDG